MEADRTPSKAEYEALTRQLRENMQDALKARRAYRITDDGRGVEENPKGDADGGEDHRYETPGP